MDGKVIEKLKILKITSHAQLPTKAKGITYI